MTAAETEASEEARWISNFGVAESNRGTNVYT
jgi:hypothetical protein